MRKKKVKNYFLKAAVSEDNLCLESWDYWYRVHSLLPSYAQFTVKSYNDFGEE